MDRWMDKKREIEFSSYRGALVGTTLNSADFTQCQCLLDKTRSSMRHILWRLLQELVRFLGHLEAMEDPQRQHFASHSVSFPPPLTYA